MKRYCGLDVHKDSVFVCIMDENGIVFQEKFGVLTFELEKLRETLYNYATTDVCMESTGVYWIPIWRVLEDYFNLKLVNPYFIKQLPGRKSDVKDAEWIATCLMKDLVRGSYVPDSVIQRLRQYNRRIFELNHNISYKLNKLDSCFQRCNIRISNYVSNINGKAFIEIARLISEGVVDAEKLLKKVHGRTVNKYGRETIIAALTGVINDTDIDCIRQYLNEFEMLKQHRSECQSKMDTLCNEYFPRQIKNILTIPGISQRSATAIIAEAGVDMSNFENSGKMVSWCGLSPRNDESAGRIKSRKITHGNKFLRQTLVECSWSASKKQGCFFNRFSYHQTAIRKKSKIKVQVAIARKILVVVWNILGKDTQYINFNDIDMLTA